MISGANLKSFHGKPPDLADERDVVEIEGYGLVHWPMCPVKGCENRIKMPESPYCHTHGLKFRKRKR